MQECLKIKEPDDEVNAIEELLKTALVSATAIPMKLEKQAQHRVTKMTVYQVIVKKQIAVIQ
jgi:hypothetical protein